MGEMRTFSAPIEAAERGGAYVTIPFDVESVFGRKRVAVKATIDGIPYRGSLVRMGGPFHVLGVLKAIREQLGKQPGDMVVITVEEDTEPRAVEAPSDLKEAMRGVTGAVAAFERLSFSHKREYVAWIEEAKRPETRARRVAATAEAVADGAQPRKRDQDASGG